MTNSWRVIILGLGLIPCLAAQQPAQSQQKLAFVVPSFIESVLQDLPATFQAPARTAVLPRLSLASLNSGLAAELSNLPASSSASAVSFVFDPIAGAYIPTTQSFGPILSERAGTLGKDRFFVAVTHQRFQFDHQDELDLRNIRTVFPVTFPAGTVLPIAFQGVVDASASYSVVVNQTTFQIAYGLTPWLDASYAFPILSNSVSIQASATFGLSASQPPLIPRITRAVQASSTGIGDGVVRLKGKFIERGGFAAALATDFRLPIGDEFNLQGAGAFGVKPFLIASYGGHSVSPHVNVGYQWNGQSFLASQAATEKQRLPSQLFFVGGADIALSKRATVAVDLLDQVILHGPGLAVTTESNGADIFRTIGYRNRTRHEVNGSGGVKVELRSDVVVTANLLFRLNTAGLRTRVAPMLGISYIF